MSTLQDIERAVNELLPELANPEWDAAVPAVGEMEKDSPLVVCAGLDPAAVPMPLLHACRRRWTLPRGWRHGYCPVCGAWPGFAEVCGVERSRYLRCLRCAAAWQAHGLACVYCGMREHAKLGRLVPEEGPQKWAIETCQACRGYLKVFTALRPLPAEAVLSKDLETVELDIAAGERGFRRPDGTGYAFHGAA
jgi:FdhE protein